MFICVECNNFFISSSNYINHIKYSHHQLRGYKCGESLCSRVFTSLESLRKHIRVKHETKLCKCNSQLSCNDNSSYGINISIQKDNTLGDENVKLYSGMGVEEISENISIETSFDETNKDLLQIQMDIHPDNLSSNNLQFPKQSCDVPDHIYFASKIYSYFDVSRFRSKCIIEDTLNLFKTVINHVEEDVLKCVESSDTTTITPSDIKPIFQQHISQFFDISTEWRCINKFQELNSYIPPEEYLLGERQEFRTENNVKVIKMIPVTAQFIPVRTVFISFFEMAGVLSETLDYMHYLNEENTLISNFIQGKL